ncbi:uncharacterized protein LOC129828487 [Salvelinus fontinalis]|uniref:uncharacterized protein LOC129828487 n=1 Tax=Salvelinus fontinalis TaxID=8038 RepID=UPI002486066B|nr:uncharacterized protein LOC129828487 [Salvelinus fontinalis]
MDVLLWRCVLGLLCTPAVLTWTVSQSPSAVSLMKVNSSAEILCSTSLPDPTGLYLMGRFHDNRDVLYLSIADRAVGKITIHNGFRGRVTVQPDQDQEVKRCCEFTLRLSQLGVEDTDSYYCSWRYYDTKRKVLVQRHSNGTIIIVRERDPEKGCGGSQTIMELILIVLSWTAFIVIFFLFIGALMWRCTRTKKHYTPARDNRRHHHHHHQHVCPQHRPNADPQFIHPSSSPGHVDFKGIL